jgi:hypothetical protein
MVNKLIAGKNKTVRVQITLHQDLEATILPLNLSYLFGLLGNGGMTCNNH